MEDQRVRDMLTAMLTTLDPDAEHALRHEDFVADMPQSGERIRGRDDSARCSGRSHPIEPRRSRCGGSRGAATSGPSRPSATTAGGLPRGLHLRVAGRQDRP